MEASIFKDREVFEETYVPPELKVRSEEARILINRYSKRLLEGTSSTDITVIYGSIGRVGIGKTTLAKFVGRQLERIMRANGVNFKFIYINVYGRASLLHILTGLVSNLDLDISVRGAAPIEVLKVITDYLYQNNMHILVAIDEFQSLLLSGKLGPDDLYLLLRVYEEIPPRDGLNRISYLLVASDIRALSALRERVPQVESQIGFRQYLPAYRSDEIYEILLQRAYLGLRPGAISDYLLSMISDVYGEDKGGDGSARRAILSLKFAAELAEAEGSSVIKEIHVRRALAESAATSIPISDLRNLPSHQLLVLLAITNLSIEAGGWVSTSEVRRMYEELAINYGQRPRGHTQFYEYLEALERIGLIEKGGKGKGRYGTLRLVPDMPPDRLKEVLEHILLDTI
ncbi:MAG: AAA family ATPase [Desulfurococcales archaeon]|nr:AAA family ATPase [Desulfurococcales archaeon]